MTEPVSDAGPHILLEGVGVAYRRHVVIEPTTLTLPSGVTAFMGNNGQGKSSMVRVLAGVQAPSSGRVVRDGRDIHASGVSLREHHARTGWLPQEAGLPRNVAVEELVAYAGWHKRVPHDVRPQATTRALERVDLAARREERVGKLSGGQRRRAALAAAIVGEPDLVLLDEPTAGLDPSQREHLHGVVRGMRTGSVVFATHLVEDVLAVADHVMFVRDGVLHAPTALGDIVPEGTAMQEASRALRERLGD